MKYPHSFHVVHTFFAETHNETDGGAVHVINCGTEVVDTIFTHCILSIGGGGAIYIENVKSLSHNISIINSSLFGCSAQYGGAAFIYCSSMSNEVLIYNSSFRSNTATKTRAAYDGDYRIFGSAIFISSRNTNTIRCKFSFNKGKYGAFKVHNKFNEDNALVLDSVSNLLLVADCEFLQTDAASNSIYYVGGKEESLVQVPDCSFRGKFEKGFHYIDGDFASKEANKVDVKSCWFE